MDKAPKRPGKTAEDNELRADPRLLRQLREISTVPQFRTQQGIAVALGVTQGFISFCERGLSAPGPSLSKRYLMLLCHHADLSLLDSDEVAVIEAFRVAAPWNPAELKQYDWNQEKDVMGLKWRYTRPCIVGEYWYQTNYEGNTFPPILVSLYFDPKFDMWRWRDFEGHEYHDNSTRLVKARWAGPVEVPHVYAEWGSPT